MLRAARARASRSAAPPATSASSALYFDQMDRKLPVGTGRDGSPIYVNLDFLDGTRGAHISISGISGVATKTSLRAVPAALDLPLRRARRRAPSTPRRWSSRSRARTCCSWTSQHPARRRTARSTTPSSACRPSRSRPSGSSARRRPDDLTGRPHVTGRTSGVDRVLVDPARVLPAAAAALRLRRRRGRTQAVHDGRPPGRRPAAAGRRPGRQRRRGQHRRQAPAAPTTNWSTSSSTGSPTTTPAPSGPARSPAIGTVNAFIRRLRSSLKPLARAHPRRPARHRAPGRSPPPTSRSPSSTCTTCRNGRSGSSSASCSPPRPPARRRPAPGGLLFTMIDELQQVRAARGQQPDQGRAAGHRRARPQSSASS